MKRFIVHAFFVIDAENSEEASIIAGDMQMAANDSTESFRKKGIERFLLIDEKTPNEEISI